jgi:hypothetical protein
MLNYQKVVDLLWWNGLPWCSPCISPRSPGPLAVDLHDDSCVWEWEPFSWRNGNSWVIFITGDLKYLEITKEVYIYIIYIYNIYIIYIYMSSLCGSKWPNLGPAPLGRPAGRWTSCRSAEATARRWTSRGKVQWGIFRGPSSWMVYLWNIRI